MNQLPYQVLFLVLCIGLGVYVNRNNFGGMAQTVFGYLIPRPIIFLVISIFIGIILWLTVNIVLLKFR